MDTQTRHALKQDKLVQATKTSVDWFEENRSAVIRAGVAAVVCLAIVIGALVVYSKRSAAADLAFGEAMDTYNAPLAQPGQPAAPGEKTFPTAAARAKLANQQFEQLANQYGLFRAGKTARYFAGLTAMDLGQPGRLKPICRRLRTRMMLHWLRWPSWHWLTCTSRATAIVRQWYFTNSSSPNQPAPCPPTQRNCNSQRLYEKTNPAEANKIYAQLKSSKSAAGQIAAQKLQQK